MSKAMQKLIPVVFLMFMFVVFSMYATGILSNADENMSITEQYQDQHNASIDVHNATLSLFAPIGLIFGVMILIIGLRSLKKR